MFRVTASDGTVICGSYPTLRDFFTDVYTKKREAVILGDESNSVSCTIVNAIDHKLSLIDTVEVMYTQGAFDKVVQVASENKREAIASVSLLREPIFDVVKKNFEKVVGYPLSTSDEGLEGGSQDCHFIVQTFATLPFGLLCQYKIRFKSKHEVKQILKTKTSILLSPSVSVMISDHTLYSDPPYTLQSELGSVSKALKNLGYLLGALKL